MTDDETGSPLRVIAGTRNLRSLPFIAREEPCETGNAWEEWLEGIEREFRYFNIKDPVDKKDALIIYGGKEVARLEKNLPNLADSNTYEKLQTKLKNHYLPKKNKHYICAIPVPKSAAKPGGVNEWLCTKSARKSDRL